MIRACIETDQPTNRPTYPCHVMSSWANHPRVILSEASTVILSKAKDLSASTLTHPFMLPEILHYTSLRSGWQNLYPTRHVILSDSEGSEYIHLRTPQFQKHFETFLQTFSRLVQSLEFPRKMPHRLVSWSVGQFYIRRASHFAQNFYLYIMLYI